MNKELVFVFCRKNFSKKNLPKTISFMIKQIVIICYQTTVQDSHSLHPVKVYDFRVFAASKPFQGGVSIDPLSLSVESLLSN